MPFFSCVPNDKIGIVTSCGKFSHVATAGCHCFLCPCFVRISGYASIRVQEVIVTCETKTKDNVFVNLQVAVQYEILREKVYEAFYSLDNPQKQISAYVFDVVRATVPRLLLDEVFESKDEIAMDVKQECQKTMGDFGFSIHQALVTDISPNEKVRIAMNEINASKRLRQATTERAEAEKLLVVKKAEAESESMFLQGQGVARQRKAIMDGLKQSVGVFRESIKEADTKDILELVLITQYFDTLRSVGKGEKVRAVFTQDSLAAGESLRRSLLVANAAKN
jgi:regulator of protease activity HflC (stomatin/prohibitin superfamily)